MPVKHTDKNKASRKEQILLTLAQMLEESPGGRITTAALAKKIDVSEAALYRHFPSKARMFEGLIEFIEDTLFTRITLILEQTPSAQERCAHIMALCVHFSERNPGMCRLLNGDALVGEMDRLRVRVAKLFDRVETQLKQILREAPLRDQQQLDHSPEALANIFVNTWSGLMNQYIRSGFSINMQAVWQAQWPVLSTMLTFHPIEDKTQGMKRNEAQPA